MPKPERVRGPTTEVGRIIMSGDPDPATRDQVRAALGLKPFSEIGPKEDPTPVADAAPEGLSEAAIPDPTPEIKLPPPTTFKHERQPDETIPAFTKIRRVNDADLTAMPWLLDRLKEHWPNVAPNTWYSRLRVYMHDNGYLFVRNDRAIALAFVARDLFDRKPWVAPVFILHADRGKPNAEDEGGRSDAIALVREIVRWARTLGATEVRDVHRHCDLPPSDIEKKASGEDLHTIFIRLK